jgi:putative membrane protein
MWLLLLIVVAAVIYLVIKSVNKYSRMDISPIDALRSRYSRGEITRNEYEQMKKDLES